MGTGLLVLEIQYQDTDIEKEKKNLSLCDFCEIRVLLKIFPLKIQGPLKLLIFPSKTFPISLVSWMGRFEITSHFLENTKRKKFGCLIYVYIVNTVY